MESGASGVGRCVAGTGVLLPSDGTTEGRRRVMGLLLHAAVRLLLLLLLETDSISAADAPVPEASTHVPTPPVPLPPPDSDAAAAHAAYFPGDVSSTVAPGEETYVKIPRNYLPVPEAHIYGPTGAPQSADDAAAAAAIAAAHTPGSQSKMSAEKLGTGEIDWNAVIPDTGPADPVEKTLDDYDEAPPGWTPGKVADSPVDCVQQMLDWQEAERERVESEWHEQPAHDDDALPPFCSRINTTARGPAGSAPLGHWPWIVLFGRQAVVGQPSHGPYERQDNVRDIICGGVLVGWGFALTSAHCLPKDVGANELSGPVVALLGDYVTPLANGTYAGAISRVRRVLRHPEADLALVLLDVSTACLPTYVRALCLPRPGRDVPLPPGLELEGAGWGRHAAEPQRLEMFEEIYHEFPEAPEPADPEEPRVLREATLKVVDAKVCEEAYRANAHFAQLFPAGFNGTKVCVEGGEELASDGFCHFTSGGWPLVRMKSELGMYELVGVSTADYATEQCRDPDLPAVYTRISAYRDWIVEHTTP